MGWISVILEENTINTKISPLENTIWHHRDGQQAANYCEGKGLLGLTFCNL